VRKNRFKSSATSWGSASDSGFLRVAASGKFRPIL
jgi:hypothetical protein